jgi:hypothetical protein
MPLFAIENPWLHHLVMHKCDRIKFPSRKYLVQEHIPNMLAKVMKMHGLLAIVQCATTTITFELRTSKIDFDTFALVINFIDDDWVPCHIIIGLFETPNTFGITTRVEQVKYFLIKYQFTIKIIVYVKDEGTNLNTLASTFISVVSCAPLQLATPFSGTYFGHVMSKTCQYAINDIKIGVGMKEMSVTEAQSALQKTINVYIDK